MDPHIRARTVREPHSSGMVGSLGQTKAVVVVAFAGVVVVAVGGTQVLRFVVERTRPEHTAPSCGRTPLACRTLRQS